MSFSLRLRWLIDTPQVADTPAAFARRTIVERLGAGNLRGVVASAGQCREAKVALEHDDLGFLGTAGKAKPGGDLALVHRAGTGQVGIDGVVDDQGVEVARIGQRPTHDQGELVSVCRPSVKATAPAWRKSPNSVISAAGQTLWSPPPSGIP